TAVHTDAEDLLGTRVVGDTQPRLLLDHVYLLVVAPVPGGAPPVRAPPSLTERSWAWAQGLRNTPAVLRGGPSGGYLAFSRISTTRQRLVADSGRVSINRTRSPMPHAFCSSCAFSLLVRRMTLPYSGCLTRSSTATTTVLSILSLTTYPSRTLRRGRCAVVAFSLMRSPHWQRFRARPRAPAHARA